MNRLIIIGNGFDLAHGLKTSYKDFIADYFYKAISGIFPSKPYIDDLIQINLKHGEYYYHNPFNKITPENSIELITEILKGERIFNLEFKSEILKRTFEQIEMLNWVDIEIEYFNVLLRSKNTPAVKRTEAIRKVNRELDFLKEKLCEYLKEKQTSFINNFATKPLVDCFY